MKKTKLVLVNMMIFMLILMVACDDSQVRKVAKATDDIALGISAAIDVKAELVKSNLITEEESKSLNPFLLKLNQSVIIFNSKARTYTNYDATARAELVKLLHDISNSMAELNASGILGIKSPTAQNKFRLCIIGINGAIEVIETILEVK